MENWKKKKRIKANQNFSNKLKREKLSTSIYSYETEKKQRLLADCMDYEILLIREIFQRKEKRYFRN